MGIAYYPEGEVEQVTPFLRDDIGGTTLSPAEPEMVGLADGRHVLVWGAPATPGVSAKVFAQFFDSSGQLDGDPVFLGEGDGNFAVAADSSGGFMASWGRGRTQAFSSTGGPISDFAICRAAATSR